MEYEQKRSVTRTHGVNGNDCHTRLKTLW